MTDRMNAPPQRLIDIEIYNTVYSSFFLHEVEF